MESVEGAWNKQTLINLDKAVQAKINEDIEKDLNKIWIMIQNAVTSNEKKISFKIGKCPVIDNHFDIFMARMKKANLYYLIEGEYHIIEFRLYDTPSDTIGNPLIEDKYPLVEDKY